MAQRALEHRVKDLERRVATVEQIAPTLATRADLAAAIAPLATKAGVQSAIQLEEERTRRHIDVVAEGLRADLRMIADGVVSLHARVDANHAETIAALVSHDRRLTRLETSRSKRR